MEIITNLFSDHTIEALSWTVLHSLWQGIAIALLMSLFIDKLKSADQKYFLALGSLAALILVSIITFAYYTSDAAPLISETAFLDTSAIAATGDIIANTKTYLEDHSSLIFTIWFSGVLLFMVKLLVSFGYIQYIKSGTPHKTLTYSLKKLQSQLGIRQVVSILESTKIKVPMVIGYIKPMILFPIGITNQLSIEEVEGIIAHELSHIKRYDYLINILQTIAEVFYYFNPAVWYINATIRAERENSCDDTVLKLGMDPATYARSLVKLEELQSIHTPDLAMAFASSKSTLINRVKRIMNMSQTKNNMKEKSIATVLLMAMTVILSTSAFTGKTVVNDHLSAKSLTPNISVLENLRNQNHQINNVHSIALDTLPKRRSTVTIQTDNNGKSMTLKKENGEIKELKIDGKVIPPSEYGEYKDMTDDVIIIDNGGNSRTMWFSDGGMDMDSIFEKAFGSFDGFDGFERFDGFDVFKGFEDFEGLEELEGLEKLKELKNLKGLENFDIEFDEEQMERFEEMMEDFGGKMEGLRFDTIFQMGPNGLGENFRFHFDSDDNDHLFHFDGDSDHSFHIDNFGNHPRHKGNKVVDVLGAELNRDGLLEPFKQNRVQLTGKHLKINGDKQPKNIWGKYKRIYEEHTGALMSKKARVDFEIEGKKSNRKIRSF